KTFVLDPIMFNRLLELNPDSVRSLTNRLLEAHNRGYWNPDEEVLEKLRDIVAEAEGQVEVVA
ncbi:MAG TPA: cobaltochelatase subunit CobN, partial [Pyrinomonadaceae bacterium]|nr:cobaltochelatase subunit CobN [Pyrinomonadaceae bacterium]